MPRTDASVVPGARAGGKGRVGVQSVEIGARIVGAIADAGQPVMLRDIAKAVGMPAAKVHRYLVSLIRQEMVEQDSFGGRYWLGPFALRVGLSALRQLDVVRMASEAIADLRDRTDHTAILSVYGSAGPTIVRWEECRHPTTVNAHVGSVLSLLDSATGRVFAAFLPAHLVEDRIRVETGDRDPAVIRKLLNDVRSRGMSLVRGSELASINAMSAPVFDHAGNLVAAITLMGSRRTFDVAWNNAMARELVACARRVSERLGHGDQQGAVAAWSR